MRKTLIKFISVAFCSSVEAITEPGQSHIEKCNNISVHMWLCLRCLRRFHTRGHNSSHTLFLMLQWQQTVHRYLRVLHSRMMKRPPKNVTMEDARNAHHMRCPLLSQGTSDENGMTTSSILDIKIEESGFILLLILLVLIELSLPWGTVPSASASI